MALNRLSHWQWTYNGDIIRDELVPFSEIENSHILHNAKSKNGSKKKTCVKNYKCLAEKKWENGLSQILLSFSTQSIETLSILWLHDVLLQIRHSEGNGIMQMNDEFVITWFIGKWKSEDGLVNSLRCLKSHGMIIF
jgi:hypothetical protein